MTGSFRKMAGGGGCVAVLAACLVALATGAEIHRNERGKTMIPGNSVINLGQQTNTWRPLAKTTANLTDVRSIKSTFEFRTFDPEGVVFYGDNHSGDEWFILALHGGVPEIQIYKADILVSVTGGPRLDDGQWHLMEVSTEGKFVLLEVDGSKALTVGLHSQKVKEVITGQLRLALGGILIDSSRLLVPLRPEMDGCVRAGSWLDLTEPWEMVEGGAELRPCLEAIQRGSYFPGSGFAVFNVSALRIEAPKGGVDIVLGGDFAQMNGTLLSLRGGDHALALSLEINNHSQTMLFTYGKTEITTSTITDKLRLIFRERFFAVSYDGDYIIDSATDQTVEQSIWREGQLAIGGLLGEEEDAVGSNFLVGCLEKVVVQGKQLDMDLSDKDVSISSHSCPVR
ncbi:sex hormone-binding globulin [Gadus morhua]|uniref:sex hormone-binding globulin n=1 Tax=Gadus morhua TaxID=8049 RepID=UPI0011B7BC63|nr:sex hormone-binding globulin [Gadus morhua]